MNFRIGFLDVVWVDILDILLVSLLLYQLFRLMKGKVATRIFVAFLSLYLLYLLVSALNMELLSNLLGQLTGFGVVAMIVLFQREIRGFLLTIGRQNNYLLRRITALLFGHTEEENTNTDGIIKALFLLAKRKIGALVVICKEDISSYVGKGTYLGAEISSPLLQSIFQKESPLHDGAVIVYQNRLVSAGCILPISDSVHIAKHFGTRHRAALGISEQTDVMALVVSEENGTVTLTQQAHLFENLTQEQVRKRLKAYLT